jgi:hypothetical protein
MSQSQRPGDGSGQPTGSGAGLDPANWEILCDAVAAAHDGDVVASQAATRRFDTDVPPDSQVGMYLWFLLRYRVVEMLGHRPSAEDLQGIAARAESRYNVIIRPGECPLVNVLRTVFVLAAKGEEVTAGGFVVAGAAALGALLNDPAADMEMMRPYLTDWWQRNLEKFRARGVLDVRSAR